MDEYNCGDCARFYSVDEWNGECSKHGCVNCMSKVCKDFILNDMRRERCVMAEYNLKPCPFCGGKADLWLEFEPYRDEYTYDERNLWHCGCKRCGITADAYWEEKWAVEEWNTRTPQKEG